MALIGDRAIPMPRRRVSLLTLKEQAGIQSESHLVRDYQSPVDVVLADDAEVDLGEGNVFRKVARSEASAAHATCSEPAKLAYFIDDACEMSVNAEQTEASLRRLFGLHSKVQLLRDLESPNDTPISETETVRFSDGPVFVTCVDIEKHCGGGEAPPPARRWIFRVDDKRYVSNKPKLTGREILVMAGKNPAATMLNQKIKKRFEPIGLEQIVDLTLAGVERFTTLPNEQSEGRAATRRQVALPEEDTDALDASGVLWETVLDGGNRWVLVHGIPLPDIFLAKPTVVAIQIPSGYPPAALDMAYFHPPVQRVDGLPIPCTEATIQIEGTSWQRWSRHYTGTNPWKPAEYNVFTHYLLTQTWLEREVKRGKV